MRGNKAEALFRSGRWDEALVAATPGAAASGVFAGTPLLLRAELFACQRSPAASRARPPRRTSAPAHVLGRAVRASARLARSRAGAIEWRSGRRPRDSRAGAGARGHRRGAPLQVAGAFTGGADRGRARNRRAGCRSARYGCGATQRRAAQRGRADAGHNAGRPWTLGARRRRARASGPRGEVDAWAAAVTSTRAMNELLPLTYALLRITPKRSSQPATPPRPPAPRARRTTSPDRWGQRPCSRRSRR